MSIFASHKFKKKNFSFVMSWLKSFFGLFSKSKQQFQMLVIGLDAAGKTSIIMKLDPTPDTVLYHYHHNHHYNHYHHIPFKSSIISHHYHHSHYHNHHYHHYHNYHQLPFKSSHTIQINYHLYHHNHHYHLYHINYHSYHHRGNIAGSEGDCAHCGVPAGGVRQEQHQVQRHRHEACFVINTTGIVLGVLCLVILSVVFAVSYCVLLCIIIVYYCIVVSS